MSFAAALAPLRRAHAALPLLIAALLVAGCADRPPAGGPITLVFKHAKILGPVDPVPALIAEFEAAHPGVRVKAEALPWSSDEQRQFLVINLEGGRPGFDVMMLDCIWVPEFARAGWLHDLSPAVPPDERAAHFASAVDAATFQGRMWALPWIMNVGLLYYRADLLARHGLRAPETHAEIVAEIAPFARARAGRDCSAISGRANSTRGSPSTRSRRCGRRAPTARRRRPRLSRARPRRRRARRAPGLIATGLTPAWTTAADEESTRRAFGKGDALFLRSWPYAADLFELPDSAVRGKVGIARSRAFPAGSGVGLHRGLAPRGDARHAPSGRGGGAGALLTGAPAQRAMTRAAPPAHAGGALPRSGAVRALPVAAADPDTHAGRASTSGDAVLRDAVGDAAARIVRGARRHQDPGAERGRCAAPSRVPPRGRAGPPIRRPGRRRHPPARQGLLLVAPALIVLAALTAYPTIWVMWLSLQRRIPIFGIERFAGFGNFAFLAGDPRFWNAVRSRSPSPWPRWRSSSWAASPWRWRSTASASGRRAALSLLLLSWALPSVVAAKLFEWLFNPTAGLVNFLVGLLWGGAR